MNINYAGKATNEEIRNRFDNDVDRFSNLDTGQATTIDAPLTMELCTEAAKYINPDAKNLLDIGCGAGNYTLKMLSKISDLNCTLNDLSLPMLERAKQRVSAQTRGDVTIIQDDMRNLNLPDEHFDIVLAAATFHHLRGDADWENVFGKLYKALKPGGSIWISDLIAHDSEPLNRLFQKRYSDYLDTLGGAEYRQKVLDYVDHEDTPRSVNYQMDLLKKVGFTNVEILHKNSYFAAFGGIK
ncbi:class I SAM-dependent methyltransferase [Mucilaginibacter sp. UR6-11]|uniref:class I SAM-dependent methyltransferase n=1 Tax=Mucilaginibacter sp. UR6-11 TaxID=1435644 RepID=UPI001E51E50D|nr:class I SAM-dependent methyltransferase [Mucilaginibacter sp. UR6-11]MCC8427062.1 class I SAM-dependent methyltransferase [Mucilaginibacter sp. UR6-11]